MDMNTLPLAVITQLDCVIHAGERNVEWIAQSSCAMTGMKEVSA